MFYCRVVLALAAALTLLAAAPARANDALRLHLYWKHQAQFAGYYMAQSRGYYSQAGLDVIFVESGPGIQPLLRLAKGDVDLSIGWLPQALEARARGADLVNVAQVFTKSGMGLVCRRSAGIDNAQFVTGKRIGVWDPGDEIYLRLWMQRERIAPGSVTFALQASNGTDMIDGKVPCAAMMMYADYWNLIEAGIKPQDLFVVRFGEGQSALLEDGIYARGDHLRDAAFRDRVARFLRATAQGWQAARDNEAEALSVVLAQDPGLEPEHQRRMLDTVLGLIPPPSKDTPFGLLRLEDFDRNVEVLRTNLPGGDAIRAVAPGAWTHTLLRQSGAGDDGPLTDATTHYLVKASASTWFYALDLIGTVAFALAGFMRAQQRRYDLWGAFILSFLPAVGGGTLRDLLVGGDRSPPFIFKDPTYLYLVFAVVIAGTLAARRFGDAWQHSRRFERAMEILDTVGLAAFTVVGAKVALVADLSWYWVPICAALTCAGGGMLLDVVTGREPRTFQGEPYEEIAVGGGLLMYTGLVLANAFEHSQWLVNLVIGLTLVGVFTLRMLVIRRGWRSFRLGTRTGAA
jgi:NitT/TauT family transport system substrate-binding protein